MEEKRPMVSVVVLTYNHEKYIKQALDSILMQKVNFDYEILIGDDASTDNTVKILEEYQNKYPNVIKLFLNKANLGATQNAYNVLMKVKGKYLATCEGDDYWTDVNKLQIQVDYLEKNKDLVGCSHYFTVVDETGNPYKKYIEWVKVKEIFTLKDFEGIYLPGQPSTFLRRNLILNNKINLNYLITTHRMIGDRTLMLLWLMNGDFGLIKEYMSAYRIDLEKKESITGKLYRNKIESIYLDYTITKKLENICRKYNKKVSFSKFKKIIFAKAVYFWILSKFNDDSFKCIKYILQDRNYNFLFIIYTPYYYLIRLIRKFFRKRIYI